MDVGMAWKLWSCQWSGLEPPPSGSHPSQSKPSLKLALALTEYGYYREGAIWLAENDEIWTMRIAETNPDNFDRPLLKGLWKIGLRFDVWLTFVLFPLATTAEKNGSQYLVGYEMIRHFDVRCFDVWRFWRRRFLIHHLSFIPPFPNFFVCSQRLTRTLKIANYQLN